MDLIAKHLFANRLTCTTHKDIDTICAFSGKQINVGVKFKDIIGDTFTDLEIFKYKSDYLSIDFALLTQPVIQGEKQLNSLRNYSFFATEKELKLLSRNEMLELLLHIPDTPFQIGVTYSNKKHIAYKAPINYNKQRFIVATDAGNVVFDVEKANLILPIMNRWYTIAKDTAIALS